MEMRCSSCGHIGQAASVIPKSSGLVLICANCAHENTLDFDQSNAVNTEPSSTAQSTPPVAVKTPTPQPKIKPEDEALTRALLARLSPESQGLRCRKCAHIVMAHDEHCGRCGLNIEDSHRHPSGEAPWEQPPPHKTEAWAQANLLWQSAQEDWSQERVDNYLVFIKEETLHELGMRHLQFYLVDHPHDALALSAISEVVALMQTKLVIARHQADQSKSQFVEEVSKIRGMLMIGTLVFWAAIFLLFAALFFKNCG